MAGWASMQIINALVMITYTIMFQQQSSINSEVFMPLILTLPIYNTDSLTISLGSVTSKVKWCWIMWIHDGIDNYSWRLAQMLENQFTVWKPANLKNGQKMEHGNCIHSNDEFYTNVKKLCFKILYLSIFWKLEWKY